MQCERMTTNYLKIYCGQTLEVEDVADRNQDGLTGQRKTQGNWVAEIGGRMSRIEVAGDICLSRPRPTRGCRADDDDDDPFCHSRYDPRTCYHTSTSSTYSDLITHAFHIFMTSVQPVYNSLVYYQDMNTSPLNLLSVPHSRTASNTEQLIQQHVTILRTPRNLHGVAPIY